MDFTVNGQVLNHDAKYVKNYKTPYETYKIDEACAKRLLLILKGVQPLPNLEQRDIPLQDDRLRSFLHYWAVLEFRKPFGDAWTLPLVEKALKRYVRAMETLNMYYRIRYKTRRNERVDNGEKEK